MVEIAQAHKSKWRKQLFDSPRVDVMITIFCDFCQFSAKQFAFFSKTKCYDQIFAKSSSSLSKIANIFANFFGENI
jgi:hypothetical protein